MMTKSLVALASTSFLLSTSCKKNEESEISALTNQNLACFDYSSAQYQQLQKDVNAVPGFFNSFSGADQQALLKHFEAIPPIYRSYLLDLKKKGTFTGIYKRDLGGGGVMGVTTSTGRGPREIALTSRHANSISFAMIHETGHAVEGLVQSRAGRSDRDWESTLQGLMTEASRYNNGGPSFAQQVRDYALTSDAEFFAESFHNFYCSPATNAFIQKNLPKTYAFLNSVLEKPVWSTGGSSPAPAPTPAPAPSPTPTPADDQGEALAQKHSDDITTSYNSKSKTCNIMVTSISRIEADGDFFLDVAALRIDGTQLPAIRMRTNYKLPIANELNDLKSIVPKVFPGCPAE